jgi:hypothetical protein
VTAIGEQHKPAAPVLTAARFGELVATAGAVLAVFETIPPDPRALREAGSSAAAVVREIESAVSSEVDATAVELLWRIASGLKGAARALARGTSERRGHLVTRAAHAIASVREDTLALRQLAVG